MSGVLAPEKPDSAAAIEQYREAATGYDRHMRVYRRWQARAVELLRLAPGDTVIDGVEGEVELFRAITLRPSP